MMKVLDAGSEPGVYAEWLSDQGAEVLGFDVGPRMVRLAKGWSKGKRQFSVVTSESLRNSG